MIRRPPRSTQGVSSAASDVYKRQDIKYDHLTDRWYVSFSEGIYTNETYKELEDAVKYAEECCNKFASVINRVISNETKASEQITRFLDGEEA